MSEQADTLQRRIRQINAQILSLDEETAQMDADIDVHRSKLGGVNAARLNNDAIDKQVRVLENRLDKVNQTRQSQLYFFLIQYYNYRLQIRLL